MSDKKIIELKAFTTNTKTRILNNIKSMETSLMELIKFYIQSNDKNINTQLQNAKTKFMKLKDIVNAYSIPPILLKEDKYKKNFLAQLKIIIFYYELVLLESEGLVEDFKEACLNLNDVGKTQVLLNDFTEAYNRFDSLMGQLDSFSSLGQFDNLFSLIGPKVKELYIKPKHIKKIMKLSKKLNLLKIEKVELPSLYESDSKKKKDKSKDSEPEEEESNESAVDEVMEDVSYNYFTKDKLIEIISGLGQSPKIKELGGIVDLTKLYSMIKEQEKDMDFSINELFKALKTLKKKGFISDIVQSGGLKLVEFVPVELTSDPKQLLEIIGTDGVETKESLMRRLNWSDARIEKVLKFLTEKSICKSEKDAIAGYKYYFPGLK